MDSLVAPQKLSLWSFTGVYSTLFKMLCNWAHAEVCYHRSTIFNSDIGPVTLLPGFSTATVREWHTALSSNSPIKTYFALQSDIPTWQAYLWILPKQNLLVRMVSRTPPVIVSVTIVQVDIHLILTWEIWSPKTWSGPHLESLRQTGHAITTHFQSEDKLVCITSSEVPKSSFHVKNSYSYPTGHNMNHKTATTTHKTVTTTNETVLWVVVTILCTLFVFIFWHWLHTIFACMTGNHCVDCLDEFS